MSEVSLKRDYFALFDDGLAFKNFENSVYRVLNSNSSFLCFQTLMSVAVTRVRTELPALTSLIPIPASVNQDSMGTTVT